MAAELQGDQTVFNHVGICVTDLARSQNFYEQVLQFRYWWELEAPDEGTSQLLQLPAPVGLKAVYLVRDGLVLELLYYSGAKAKPFRERVMNEPGLTHLSLSVGDIAAVVAKVVPNGGTVVEETDMKAAIIIRDPDGQLIELTTAAFLDARPPLPA
jgi:catechol 2,3-dioxygenase-like lactoylglutathione lyase family enzyme